MSQELKIPEAAKLEAREEIEWLQEASRTMRVKLDKQPDNLGPQSDKVALRILAKLENFAQAEADSRQLYEALVKMIRSHEFKGQRAICMCDMHQEAAEAIRVYEGRGTKEGQDGADPEKLQVQTAAFCAYVVAKENCTQPEAVKRMAEMCTVTELMLIGVRSRGKQEDTHNG